jgi:hypothetical protein
MIARFISALVFMTAFSSQAALPGPTQDEMLAGITTIQNVFQNAYAMKDWKKDHLGFDLVQAFDSARAEVRTNSGLTLKQYQRSLKKVLSDMNDYHVGIHFARTESASLPLSIRGSQGRYFIVYINRDELSQTSFPFQLGDELIEFNGHPVAEEIAKIHAIYYGGVEQTDQALAELFLTSRSAANGLDVPQGPVLLKIKSAGAIVARAVQVIWKYTPELIQNDVPAKFQSHVDIDATSALFQKQMVWGGFTSPSVQNDDPFMLGAKKSFIPALGTKIWESGDDSKFHSYVFRTEANHILGYIRVPHYTADGTWVSEFAKVIANMEKSTDALVIDEINNPGGSVFYLYALASLLTQDPLFTPHHQMKITTSDIQEGITLEQQLKNVTNDDQAKALLGAEMSGYPVTYEFVQFTREWIRFVRSEWNAGRTLTQPYYLYGVDKINPYPGVTYSKPILLLINQLDFSGGDFFPAILQDNNRVTVMGTRTAGAGGYIGGYTFPNNLGIASFSVTNSIARRIKDQPIENLGVTPDIAYDLTPADFMTGFAPYRKAILTAVEGLIK